MKILAILLLLPAIASARIGESPDQCAKRYGEVDESHVGKGWQTTTYGKEGITTTCWYRDGKCVCIAFLPMDASRVEPGRGDAAARFTSEQTEKLLAANGGGSKWLASGGTKYQPVHRTEDGTRLARTGDVGITIQLVSDIEERGAMLTPEAISKTIEGF